MPREMELNPCREQKELLESLGFQHPESSWDYPLVTWFNFGVSLKVWKEQDKPTVQDVIKAVVLQAREDGRTETQKAARDAFNKAFGITAAR